MSAAPIIGPTEHAGGPVVERLLGEVVSGLLIVDGGHAYTKIVCDRQICMAHIFRTIRAFIDAFPHYRSIMTFYLQLRRIIRDGEKLQATREGLSELVVQRRLKALEHRLDALLEGKPPNDTLKEVIKKVRRQKDHILTFIKHDGAPPPPQQLRRIHHQEGGREAEDVRWQHVCRRRQGLCLHTVGRHDLSVKGPFLPPLSSSQLGLLYPYRKAYVAG